MTSRHFIWKSFGKRDIENRRGPCLAHMLHRLWKSTIYFGLWCIAALCGPSLRADTSNSSELSVTGEPGSDITAALQKAIDETRMAGGGTIDLPAGTYAISDTIELAGTKERFPHGRPTLVLRGGPTFLTYKGGPNKTVLDMEAPNNCTISNLSIDGNNVPGTVGIRYRAGYERGVNGGKSNNFSNISLARFDIGFWIGDPFAPDLVGCGFYALNVTCCRICLLVEGGNVAGMTFYNPLISGYREAGIKLVGEAGRLIRRTQDDPRPPQEVPDSPSVLTNIQTGEEIFEKSVPEYALKNRALKREFQGTEYYWAPGGAPEIAIYNANFGGQAANAWSIDSNWGNVRLYSARIEGVQGFFRRTSTLPPGRFTDVFFDVNVVSYGGTTGNVMEYHGPGPFYLYGGVFSGRVALGNNTQIYAVGTRFEKGKMPFYPGLVPPGFALPDRGTVSRIGKQEMFPGEFAMYDAVQVAPVEKPGFVQLAGTKNARILSSQLALSGTITVTSGQKKISVPLTIPLPNDAYQVSATPHFNAGGIWISEKTAKGFVLNWGTPATSGEAIDWTLQYPPYRIEN